MRLFDIPATVSCMLDSTDRINDTTHRIANRVRGLAVENRFTHQRIAEVLGISRASVVGRMNGRIPFSATEVLTLAWQMSVPVARFFPDAEEPMQERATSAPPAA